MSFFERDNRYYPGFSFTTDYPRRAFSPQSRVRDRAAEFVETCRGRNADRPLARPDISRQRAHRGDESARPIDVQASRYRAEPASAGSGVLKRLWIQRARRTIDRRMSDLARPTPFSNNEHPHPEKLRLPLSANLGALHNTCIANKPPPCDLRQAGVCKPRNPSETV